VLERAFDPARALELVARERVTTMMGVPITYERMPAEPGFAADVSSLLRAIVGGAPMDEGPRRAFAARGVEIVEGYGLTEAAPNVLLGGRPYPHVDVALRDPDGARLDGPAEGELMALTAPVDAATDGVRVGS
jgi:fatty-acyl-CoA synthase